MPKLSGGSQPAVSGDHIVVAIDQHRHVKAKSLDAVGDLPDLLLAVAPRVSRIRFELVDRPVDNRHPRRTAGRLATRCAKVVH